MCKKDKSEIFLLCFFSIKYVSIYVRWNDNTNTDINITLDNFFRVFIISSTARCNSLHLKCNTITNHQNQRKTQKLCDIWPCLCRDVQNKTEGRPLHLSKISVLSDATGLAARCTKASTYRTDNSA